MNEKLKQAMESSLKLHSKILQIKMEYKNMQEYEASLKAWEDVIKYELSKTTTKLTTQKY